MVYAAGERIRRGAAHFILARGQPSDAVVVEPAWAWPGMAHYLRGAVPPRPQSRFPSAAWRAPDPLSDELGETYREWLGRGWPGDDRLRLVERLRGKPSSELDVEWLPAAVAVRYCVRATQVTRRVLVQLVERCH